MSILIKAENKAQQRQKITTSIIDFAREMASLTSKSIFGKDAKTQQQPQSQISPHPIIVEEKDDEIPEIKSSILSKRNNDFIQRAFTFQSQLSDISLKNSQATRIKKESKIVTTTVNSLSTSINKHDPKRTNSDHLIQNKVTAFLIKNLNDDDSSDEAETCENLTESETWTVDLVDKNHNETYYDKGKLTLYGKGMQRNKYRKAKLNEERKKKIETMTNQLKNVPEITEKSRRIVERMNEYTPLYLRAGELHSKKKTKVKFEEKKMIMTKGNYDDQDNQQKQLQLQHQHRHQESKAEQLTDDSYAFLLRQETWNEYVIHKRKTMKLQKEKAKLKTASTPHTNKKSAIIISDLVKETNNDNHQVDTVFNRLFTDKEQQKARQQYRNNKAKCSFTPKINAYIPSYIKKAQVTTKNSYSSNTKEQQEPSILYKALKPTLTSLSLTRNTPKQFKHNTFGGTTYAKSRNLTKSTGEQYEKRRDEDEEYVMAQSKLALSQMDNYKPHANILSRNTTDNNTTNFSIYNKSRDDNTNYKSKKTLKRSTSNITKYIGIPDMFKGNIDIVKENPELEEEIGNWNRLASAQTVKHLGKTNWNHLNSKRKINK